MTAGRGWAYTGAILGATVSIAANVAHSFVPPTGAPQHWSPQPGAVAMSVVWPVFVLVALEILARVQWPAERRWTAVRWCGLIPVGVVAAIVSYRHLSALLDFYGEDDITTLIGPLAVDGIMLLASGALLAGTSRTVDTTVETIATTTVPATVPTIVPAVAGTVAQALAEPLIPAVQPDAAATVPTIVPTVAETVAETVVPEKKPARQRPVSDTRARVLKLREKHPDMTATEIALKVDRSVGIVRRYLAETKPVQAPDAAPDDAVVVPDQHAELVTV